MSFSVSSWAPSPLTSTRICEFVVSGARLNSEEAELEKITRHLTASD